MTINRRQILYSSLIIVIVLIYAIYSSLINPAKNANYLKDSKEYGLYESWIGSLTLEDRQYTLCIYTAKDLRFYPVEYLLIFRTSKKIEVQLICGPGEANVILLKNEEAKSYLEEHQIILTELNTIIQ